MEVSENIVLYCDEQGINDQNICVPIRDNRKPKQLHLPYLFEFFHEHGLLIPSHLWNEIGGLRPEYAGAEFEDLLLRLHKANASFQHVPVTLYLSREKATCSRKLKSVDVLSKALQDHSESTGLQWQCSEGFRSKDIKIVPEIVNFHSIQVIIPFKEQKELTLKCLKTILGQTYSHFKITAVDNDSSDKTIAEEIRRCGGEVITIKEPFNYSRLNNLAVSQTKTASDCDLILFLNNDIELEPDAFLEMVRWIDQPKIGMVGCRLHYPDGRLQHGGVDLNIENARRMNWRHIDKLKILDTMDLSKKLMVTDAVTTACALVKRQNFLDVGGFDEIWYPIAYSDTNLAVKLGRRGLLSFYTPYAKGIHHESVSRKSGIEDYENMWWLHNMLEERDGLCRTINRQRKI
jgi:GT2 family glycosyltransferase